MDKKDREIRRLEKVIGEKFHLLSNLTEELRQIKVCIQQINNIIDLVNSMTDLDEIRKAMIIEQLSMAISDKIGLW